MFSDLIWDTTTIGQLLIELVTPATLEMALRVQEEIAHRAEQADAMRAQWHSFSKKSHSFNSLVFPQDLDDLQLINRSVFV